MASPLAVVWTVRAARAHFRQLLLHLEDGQLRLPSALPVGVQIERELPTTGGCRCFEAAAPRTFAPPVTPAGDVPRRQTWWWVCWSELRGEVCGRPVAAEVAAVADLLLTLPDGARAATPSVWYHGTDFCNVASIAASGLRPSADTGRGAAPMLGRAVYVGPFAKAMRYSFHESQWTPRRDRARGGLVRVAVLAPPESVYIMGTANGPCRCRRCGGARDDRAALVDHTGSWRSTFRAAIVPTTTPTGRRFASFPEMAIADPDDALILSAHEADMSTRPPPDSPYDPTARHRIL